MIEYTVVYGLTISELCSEVNKLLAKGYLLQGGVCPTAEGRRGYHQAMIAVVEGKKNGK